MQYSQKFKARMVGRMVGPAAISANALAREVGVRQGTLSRWLLAADATVRAMEKDVDAAPKVVRSWRAEEKLQAVMDSISTSGDELGAFLRRSGLHQVQLDEWRKAVLTAGLEALESSGSQDRKTRKRDKRVRELEKELRRKDRALAETAALLVLEKKVQALWGAGDDDTEEESEK